MMENTGADNLVEAHPQLAYLLDCKLMDLKIFQIVFTLEFLRTLHTRCADIDAGNLSCGPTQGMLCCLRRSAACDENGMVFAVGSVRPEEMVIRATPVRVVPEPTVLFETIDRSWIRITVVEASDLICCIK